MQIQKSDAASYLTASLFSSPNRQRLTTAADVLLHSLKLIRSKDQRREKRGVVSTMDEC